MAEGLPPKTVYWQGGLDGRIEMIDQTLLPGELTYLHVEDVGTVFEAIRSLRVRGAPAIGIAAAMGVILGVRGAATEAEFFDSLKKTCDFLGESRPTAVNLFWALDRMRRRAEELRGLELPALKERLLAEAKAIRDEDAEMCRAIGRHGERLIPEGGGVLTHCNAGSLATAEYGTALAPMYAAHQAGRRFRVYVDETRPLLQGSRLTAWELSRAGIDARVICDNMAAVMMREGRIDLVIVGADRIAANGDTANKIGTYGLAVAAKYHGIRFYVAAPSSTFDWACRSGTEIPIEYRDGDEIRRGFGRLTAPENVECVNPAFDVTPAELIRGIVSEKGIVEPVTRETLSGFFHGRSCNGGRSE